MLKRKSRIHKYITLLKRKQLKKHNLKDHTVLKHKIQHTVDQPKLQQLAPMAIQVEEQREPACWYDPDQPHEDQQLELGDKNKFRKLTKKGLGSNPRAAEYQASLQSFYEKKYQGYNWADNNQEIEEKDVNDYLNQQVYFSDKRPASRSVKFYSKTSEKHESVVTGLDWHKNIMFSCGLDHKLKVWHFQPDETNPELKLKQEKDIFIQDLPLSNCYYRHNSLMLGTLRKNLVVVDTEKWKPTFITSNFLKQHKTYQNLRVSASNQNSAIFTHNQISFLDRNNVFVGNLLANQPLEDVCFGNGHSVCAVSNDNLYEWDLRKFGIVRLEKKYLGFTSITVSGENINVGSKLGTVYIYNINNFKDPVENSNLVTHVTQVKANASGQMCIALSKWKSNAIRVIDSMSGRSIGDWPGPKTKVGLPLQACFNSLDYFGVGSSSGHVSVYGFSNQIL